MYKSRYPWLKDMKESGKKKSNIDITKITVLGGSPISGRTDISFTGYGEDGRLQQNRPTDMFGAMGGPVMEHEGEARIDYPDGEKAVIPANQLSQDVLAKIEGKGMRGAQKGGTFMPATTPPMAQGMGKIQAAPQITPPPIEPEPIIPNTITPQPLSNQMTPPNILPDPIIGHDMIAPKIPIQQPLTPGIAPVTIPGVKPPIPPTPSGMAQKPPVSPLSGGLTTKPPVVPPVPGQGMAQKPPVTPISEGLTTKPPISTLPEEKPPEDQGSYEYQQALQKLKKYSEGRSPYDEQIREEERMRLAGEEAAARSALEQQGAQLGLTPKEMLLEQAMLGREFGAQETALMAALRKGEADRAYQASMALPGATLAGMQFQYQKQFDTVAQSNWEQAMAWDKETWQKQFGFNKDVWEAEFGHDKEKWEQMTAFEREKWLMDNSQWQMMFDLGVEQWDYGKKMDMVNALISQGGEGNYDKASTLLKSLFGTDIDFSNSLQQENAAKFNQGMSQISKYIASGMKWDDALDAMKKDGTLDLLGMDEGDVQKMYEKMILNADPVYQLMNSLDDSTLKIIFPDMTPEKAKEAIAKLSIFGGIKFNEDGSFSIDADIFDKIFGEQEGGPDPDYNYQDYVKDAEQYGLTALSEEEWNEQGGENFNDYKGYRKSALDKGVKEENIISYQDWLDKESPSAYETVLDIEERFDAWTGNMPEQYNDSNLNAEIWEDLGKPSMEEYQNWYDGGGKNYLKLHSQNQYISDIKDDLYDIKEKKGEYAYLNDIVSGNDRKNAMTEAYKNIYETQLGGKDAKENLQWLYSEVAPITGDSFGSIGTPLWDMSPEIKERILSYRLEKEPDKWTEDGKYRKAHIEGLTKKGYTEKQAKEMIDQYESLRHGRVERAYNIGIENGNIIDIDDWVA